MVLNTNRLYKLSKSVANSEVNPIGMFRVEGRIRETEAAVAQWNISKVKLKRKGGCKPS